jgi:hypothetical protein
VGATADPSTRAASRSDEVGHAVTQPIGMVLGEVNLVLDTVQAEGHGADVVGRRAVQIVDQLNNYLLRHASHTSSR